MIKTCKDIIKSISFSSSCDWNTKLCHKSQAVKSNPALSIRRKTGSAGVDLGLIKLVVMTNVFSNKE